MKRTLLSTSTAILFSIFLTGCFPVDDSKTRFQLDKEGLSDSTKIIQFFEGFEELLASEGGNEWRTYKYNNQSEYAIGSKNNVTICRAGLKPDHVWIICAEAWKPWLFVLIPRTSDYHQELIQKIAKYVQPLGFQEIKTTLYNGDVKIIDPISLLAD